MGKLDNLKPQSVFGYFEDICSIPHGSGNTKQISDYLVDFAVEHGLEHYQDASNNVIIIKEAAEGYENAAPVIIQGHIDMVCEKDAGKEIDFEKEGITPVIEGDWLRADGTTLGGDDGIAVAMALAALSDDSLQHPRLECVFTVDEEVGMFGAEAMDVSRLTAKKFLNIDSEEEGIFTVSCAGGVTAKSIIPVKRKEKEGNIYKLGISGLLGGHSGQMIDQERGNASILMGRLLYSISKDAKFRLVSLEGGQKDNAITKDCTAEIRVKDEYCAAVEKTAADFDKIVRHEFKTSDPGAEVSCVNEGVKKVSALDKESTSKVITLLVNHPQGVQRMSRDIDGLVETSLNLGILKLGEKELEASASVRSSVASEKNALTDRLTSLTEYLGGRMEFTGDYPGWEFKDDSEFRDTCVEVFTKQYGKEPVIQAIHAGLECGLFAGKIAGLDAVSIGPDMEDVHTSSERLNIPSVQRTWAFVAEVLKQSR
ncbi:MAG: aminoacyl-histidine dipeptidase [Eubacteriaceae bacterium]|jgi:dipeptidase D|nr:aminoacyl-histidine dipeptidase [Eubacteriaceae bacterium]